MMYVDLGTMEVCTAGFLTRTKHPGLVVKNLSDHPLTDDDLARLGAARLDESATGDIASGRAFKTGGVYYREYRPFTAEELAAPAKAALAETDAGMTRTEEDIIDTLERLGIMAKTELPQSTQDRHADKKAKRAAL